MNGYNVGLWNARGAFIAYLDTDFEYAPSYLASIVERSHDVGATLSGYDVAGGLMRVEIRVNTQISRGGAVPVTCPTCISGIAHRRTLAISVGGVNELLEIGYEWELTKRIARTGCEIGVLPTSAGRRHLPPLTVDACGLVELTRDISGPVIDREAACGAGSQRRGTPPSGGVNGNLEIKKRRRSAMLGNCVAGRPLYDDSSIRSPDHAVGALPPAVGRRRTKVLFASPHSLIDPTCGAAIASLRGLELLHEQGLPCSVFTGTLLDASEEMLFDEILAKRRVPYETHAVQLGDTRIRLSFTSHGKVPVTVFRNGSTRSGWTDSENNAFIAAFERLLNYDRPDVLVNFGGDAISDRMMAAAKLRDIPIVAWIHNLAYTDQSHFQAADYAVVPSKFAQQYYVERVGLAAQVLPNVIDDPAIRVTRHDPRYVTFVNPHPTKGVFVFSRIALELQKARPDIPVLVVESRGKSGWLQQAGLDLSRCPNITVIENTPFPRKFYAQTKILLMPSLWEESFGLTTAEALLNGIPVLASNRGGNPEAVGDAGFLLDIPAKYTPESREQPTAEEVAPWVETVIRLWDDSAFYAAAVERAKQHAERWRPEVLGPIYRELFEKVCPQPGPPLIPAAEVAVERDDERPGEAAGPFAAAAPVHCVVAWPVLPEGGPQAWAAGQRLWRATTALATRDEIPALLAEWFPQGRGAEVGVFEGRYSEILLRGWQPGEFYAIDPWREFAPHEYVDPVNAPQPAMDALYERARRRLDPHTACQVVRKTSVQAAADFPDGHFDFVYIDAAHDFKSVMTDLTCWWPKVRPGGVLAGHDYFLYIATNLRIEVPIAVNEFFSRVAPRPLAVTRDDLPSWLAVK